MATSPNPQQLKKKLKEKCIFSNINTIQLICSVQMFSSIFLMVVWVLCTTPIQKNQTGRISKGSTVALVNITHQSPLVSSVPSCRATSLVKLYLFDLKFLGESSSYQHRSDLMFPSLLSVLVFSSS